MLTTNGVSTGLAQATYGMVGANIVWFRRKSSTRRCMDRAEVDKRLQMIMKSIHKAAMERRGAVRSPGNYVVGANIAGFLKVVDAMMDQGVV